MALLSFLCSAFLLIDWLTAPNKESLGHLQRPRLEPSQFWFIKLKWAELPLRQLQGVRIYQKKSRCHWQRASAKNQAVWICTSFASKGGLVEHF
jgi:hypothetical protein